MQSQQTVQQNKPTKLFKHEQNKDDTETKECFEDKDEKSESSISIDQNLLQDLHDDEFLRNQLLDNLFQTVQSCKQHQNNQFRESRQQIESLQDKVEQRDHRSEFKQQELNKHVPKNHCTSNSQQKQDGGFKDEGEVSRQEEVEDDLQIAFSQEKMQGSCGVNNGNNIFEDFEDMNESSPEKQEWSEHEDEDEDEEEEEEDNDYDDEHGRFCKPKTVEINPILQQLQERSNLFMKNLEPYQAPLSTRNGEATVDDFLRIKFQQLYSKPQQQMEDDDNDSTSICIDTDVCDEQQNLQENFQEIEGSGNAAQEGFVGCSKTCIDLEKQQEEFQNEKDLSAISNEQIQQEQNCEIQGSGAEVAKKIEVKKPQEYRRRNKFTVGNQIEDDEELMQFLNELDSDIENDSQEIANDESNCIKQKNKDLDSKENIACEKGDRFSPEKNENDIQTQMERPASASVSNKRSDSFVDSDDEEDQQQQKSAGDVNDSQSLTSDDENEEFVQEGRRRVQGFFEEEAELSEEEGEMSDDELEEYLAAIEGDEKLGGFIQNEDEIDVNEDEEQEAQKLHLQWQIGQDEQIEKQLVKGFKEGFHKRRQKRMYLADDAVDDEENDDEKTKRRRIALQQQRKNSSDSNFEDDDDEEEYENSPNSRRSNDMEIDEIQEADDEDDFEKYNDVMKNRENKNPEDFLSFRCTQQKRSGPLFGSQFKRQLKLNKSNSKNSSPQESLIEDVSDDERNYKNQNKSRIFVGGKLLGQRKKQISEEMVEKGCSQMEEVYGYQNFTSFVRKPTDQSNVKNEQEMGQKMQYQQQQQRKQFQNNINNNNNSRKGRYRSNIHSVEQSTPKLLDIVNKQNLEKRNQISNKEIQSEKVSCLESLLRKVNQGGRKP